MANVYTIWVWRELGKSSLQFFFIRFFFHFLAAHAAISPPRSKSSDNLAELSRSTPRSAQYCNFLRDFIHQSFLLFLPASNSSWRFWPSQPFMFQTPQVISKGFCSHHKKVCETQTESCTSRTRTIISHPLSRLRFCPGLVFKFSAIPFSIAVYKLEVRGVKKCFDEHSRSSPRHLGIRGWCPTCNRAPFRTLASSLQLCSVPRTCTFSNVLSTHIASSRTLPSLPPSYPLVWGTTIFLLTLKFVLMTLTLVYRS